MGKTDETRLSALERHVEPGRRAWQVRIVEGVASPELRCRAVASGWRLSDGPYVIEVLLPEGVDYVQA